MQATCGVPNAVPELPQSTLVDPYLVTRMQGHIRWRWFFDTVQWSDLAENLDGGSLNMKEDHGKKKSFIWGLDDPSHFVCSEGLGKGVEPKPGQSKPSSKARRSQAKAPTSEPSQARTSLVALLSSFSVLSRSLRLCLAGTVDCALSTSSTSSRLSHKKALHMRNNGREGNRLEHSR
jgi:hypothetical protein